MEVYPVLSYFTIRTFYRWASLLQKHFTVGLFSAKTLYRWAISYSMLFNHVDVSVVGIVYGSFLSVSKDQETPIFPPVNSPKCSMVMDGHPLVAMQKNL